MWPTRQSEINRIENALSYHHNTLRPLPGIADSEARRVLATQFIASIRREDYYRLVQKKQISAQRANPNSLLFDAERAVAFHVQQGNVDEGTWLIFLMTHFGRPVDTGWLRLQQIYGRLGTGVWDWISVSTDPPSFYRWLDTHWQQIGGKFGNHRKYESLDPNANRPMAQVVADYLRWIGPDRHARFFAKEIRRAGNDPNVIFDSLYKSIDVLSFGRLAKLDYLALLGRYGIAPIFPGSAYLSGATGPRAGAQLLFSGQCDGKIPLKRLQDMLDELDITLKVGMLVYGRRRLCNWQKKSDKILSTTKG